MLRGVGAAGDHPVEGRHIQFRAVVEQFRLVLEDQQTRPRHELRQRADLVRFQRRRADLRLRGVMRSDELGRTRGGRRVRVAGAVITRQRPGTAKGMVFLTLEDEVGLANVIIRPDVFERQRPLILRAPFLVVEGVLQQQEGVTSVRAERVMGFAGDQPGTPSHDFR